MKAELARKIPNIPTMPSPLDSGRGWYVRSGGLLTVFDNSFARIRQFSLGADVSMSAVCPDLTRVLIGRQDQVSVLDQRGATLWSVAHTRWGTGYSLSGSGRFSADGQLVWITVPETPLDTEADGGLIHGPGGGDSDSGDGQEVEGSGWAVKDTWGDQWWVLDAATGAVKGRGRLGVEATGSVMIPHPNGIHLGLAVGLGQDGSRIYWGYLRDGSLRVATDGDDTWSLADIHPDGIAYLTLSREGAELTVRDFPSHLVLARRHYQDILRPGEMGCYASYLDAEHIIAETVDGSWRCVRHIVLNAQDLRVIGEVHYPPPIAASYLQAGRDGTWLTIAAGALSHWRLAPGTKMP